MKTYRFLIVFDVEWANRLLEIFVLGPKVSVWHRTSHEKAQPGLYYKSIKCISFELKVCVSHRTSSEKYLCQDG